MTVIGFIRHGVTDWNAELRVQGHTDIPLNEEGRKQAQAIAKRIKAERWEYVYSSDLSRAYETAQAIAAAIGLNEVHTHKLLRESYCGKIEGTTEEERIAKWGENWRSLDLERESKESVMERGLTCVQELTAKHPSQRILLVSHGGLIGNTLKALIPDTNTEAPLHNTSLTVLSWKHARWECQTYNCNKHLL